MIFKQFIFNIIYRCAKSTKKLFSLILPASFMRNIKVYLLEQAYPIKKDHPKSHLNIEGEGVTLIGYSRAEMGIGESCRIAARSLDSIHYPFSIVNFTGSNSAPMTNLSWQHKEVKTSQYGVNIFHINAEQMIEVYGECSNTLFNGKYNIGYWHWELPDFPDRWVSSFKLVDEVWAPSFFVMDAISKKSPVPVVRIPHSIKVEITEPRDRGYFNIPEHTFIFLSMYDVNSYKERKNPIAAIKAFKHCFAGDDMSVGLVIKVNAKSKQLKEIDEINEITSGYQNIFLIVEVLTRNDLNALISVSDCYVSLHRSEGFGLVPAEAMYLGKPVIATGWSSNTDFMSADNSCLVNYTLENLKEDYGPYEAYQYWANPDIEHAAYYMGKLVSDSKYRFNVAAKGQQTIQTEFSPEVVANLIKNRLDYIRSWRSE